MYEAGKPVPRTTDDEWIDYFVEVPVKKITCRDVGEYIPAEVAQGFTQAILRHVIGERLVDREIVLAHEAATNNVRKFFRQNGSAARQWTDALEMLEGA